MVTACVCGLLVFLFLAIFQPTRLHTLSVPMLLLTALADAVISSAILIFALFVLMPLFFREKNNFGRLTMWSLSSLLFIAHGILLSNVVFQGEKYRLSDYLALVLATVSVGTFILIIVVTTYNLIVYKRNTSIDVLTSFDIGSHKVRINTQDSRGQLEVTSSSLLYVSSLENYIRVCALSPDGQVEKTVVRATMKGVERDLSKEPQFWRCHRGFIVNMRLIDTVSQIGQGYQITMQRSGETIPVSRSQIRVARRLLTEQDSVRP